MDEMTDEDVFGPEPSVSAAPQELSDEDVFGPQYSQTEAALGHLARGAIPAGAGAAAGVYGAGYGAAAGGLVAGPVGAVAGGIIGGLGGAFGTSMALGAIQDKVLEKMGWDKPLDAMREQHPTTSMLAEMAPGLAVGRPNLKSLDLANRAIGGAVGGGIEGAQQIISGDFDATRLGANIAAGAAFSRTNRLGDKVQEQGIIHGAKQARPFADPTRVQARDLYQAARNADTPNYRGSNPLPDPDDLPAPTHEQMDTANDVTTVARGVAAENAPPPDIDVGNPDASPGPYKAKGGDSSYIKRGPADDEPMGMGNMEDIVRGPAGQEPFPDTGLAQVNREVYQRGDVPPDVQATFGGVIPEPIDTGLAPISESLRANLDDNYGVPQRSRRLPSIADEHQQDVMRAETAGMQGAVGPRPGQGMDQAMPPVNGRTQRPAQPQPRNDNVGPFSPDEEASMGRMIDRMDDQHGGAPRVMTDEEVFGPAENMSPRGGAPTQEELHGGRMSPQDEAEFAEASKRWPTNDEWKATLSPEERAQYEGDHRQEMLEERPAKKAAKPAADTKEIDTFLSELDKRGLGKVREKLEAITDPEERSAAAERAAKALKELREETGIDTGKHMDVLAAVGKDKNWSEREHGLGKGPKKDRYYTSNGAEVKSKAEYERKQGDLDKFLKFYDTWGPNSEKGKALPPDAQRSEVRDYAKNLVAELTHEFGGKDPLARGNAYISTKKGHIDTAAIEYLRAAKRVATRNEDIDRFVDLHASRGDTDVALSIADTRNQDVAQQKRPGLPEAAQEEILAATPEGQAEQFVGPRKQLKEFRDPEHKEADFYNAEQNELRDWINQLSDEDYELLSPRQDLKLDVATTQDPGRVLARYIADLDVAKKENAARLSSPQPVREGVQALPQEKPKSSEVRGVSADVYAQYAQQAAAEKLTPEQIAAAKARKEKLAAKKEPEPEPEAPKSDELDTLIKSQADDEAATALVSKFLSDEQGGFGGQFIKNILAKRKNAQTNPQHAAHQVYADAVHEYVGKAHRSTADKLVEVDRYVRGAAAAAEAQKIGPHKQRKIYEAIESRTTSQLPPDMKKYYDDWVEPARRELQKAYQDLYDLNQKYGFRDDLPDPSILTPTDYLPRFGIGEAPSTVGKIFDPYQGRGLSGYSENLLNRGYFALTNAAGDRAVIKMEPRNPDHFLILRRGAPPRKVPFPQGFDGNLGQAIDLTINGKKDIWQVDHGRTGEIEHATKRGVRFHQNAPWSVAEALNNQYAAFEQMKLMAKLVDDKVIDSVVVHTKDEARERGYDTVPTRLTNTPLFKQYGSKDVYLPNAIRWELDDYSRPGLGGDGRFVDRMRRISTEFAKIFNLNAPLVHVLNETNRYLIGRGGKWLNPVGTAKHLASMPAALDDVIKQGKWQSRMREAGIEPLWSSTFLQHNMEAMKQKFGMEITRNGSKWDPIFKIWGITAKEFYDKWYRGTSHMTWMPIDVLTTMRFMEEVKAGWSDAEAAKRVNQWGADYSVKRTLLGSRGLQEAAVDPAVTLFGRWKRSLFESLASSTRNLLKGDQMLRDRAKRANFGDRMAEVKARQEALGQLMTIAVLAVGMGEIGRSAYNAVSSKEDKARKPWTLNRAMEAATGRQGIEMRPRGANAIVEKAAGITAGTKGLGDFMTHVWSPNPAIQVGVDMLRQKDWRGEDITLKGNMFRDPGVIPSNIGSLAEYGAGTAAPIYGTLSRGYKKQGKLLQGVEDLAYEQFGINAPSEKANRYQQKQEVYNARERRRRDKNPQGIIPDIINAPFKR